MKTSTGEGSGHIAIEMSVLGGHGDEEQSVEVGHQHCEDETTCCSYLSTCKGEDDKISEEGGGDGKDEENGDEVRTCNK